MQSQNRNSDLGACSQVAVFVFDFILCVQRTHSTAVNEINVERLLRHIYELGAWLVTFNLPYFFRDQFCPRHSESGAVCYPLGSNVGHACSIIRNRTLSQNILNQKSY